MIVRSLITLALSTLSCEVAFADTADWMSEYAPSIQEKTIKDIIIPGTHDSATYELHRTFGKGQDVPQQIKPERHTLKGVVVAPIAKKISQAQNLTIQEQLEAGFRFLDLRVVYNDKKKEFTTVHGLVGPSVDEVLKGISSFAAQHPKEIIIIQVGDLRHMPEGEGDHAKLIQKFREALGNKLISKNNGLTLPFKDIWAEGKQIILLYDGASGVVGQMGDVWETSSFLESYWANEDTIPKLKEKLDQHLVHRNTFFEHKLYVVQAVLTPSKETLIKGLKKLQPQSLRRRSDLVKQALPQWLQEWKDKNPNIIIIDYGDKKTAESIIQLNKER